MRNLLLLQVFLLVFGSRAVAEDPAGLRFYLPPEADGKADPAAAEKLFSAAKAAAGNHQASRAYQLAYEALHTDPNCAAARKLLGYVKFRDAWHTPFEVRQLSAGKVWNDKFGWLPADSLPRYEKGESYYRSRWMPAKQEAKLRSDIQQGWRVESEHYAVLTNHSLEAGVELTQRLERLHTVWTQIFAAYVIDDTELVRRFDGKASRSRGVKQHEVVYYRTRDEYNAALRPQQPKIDMTLGIYFDTEKTAYFFAGDGQDTGTLWHEATHQLFSESRPVAKNVGRENNFWVIEAVACYMESRQEHLDQGFVTLGEIDAGRLPAARERLLVDNFYVPLVELVPLGMAELQSSPRIAKIYSQSAGLATFFLDSGEGKYREPFVAYLRSVYDGRIGDNMLSRLIGRTDEQLDAEYREWMQSISPP